jgi:hypothetical protein
MTCGIYQLIHISGMRYIGESHDIETRRARHWQALRCGTHDCLELQMAWEVDGEALFACDVLEAMPSESTIPQRRWREDVWRYVYREWIFRMADSAPARRQQQPDGRGITWSLLIIPRCMHLGPPNGMQERRVVMYSGRSDHRRLAAIRDAAKPLLLAAHHMNMLRRLRD